MKLKPINNISQVTLFDDLDSPNLLRRGVRFNGSPQSLLTFTSLPQLNENSTTNLIISFNFSTVSEGLVIWHGKVRKQNVIN